MAVLRALKQLTASVLADFASTQKNRAKYHDDRIPLSRLPRELVSRIGLQMLASVRVMQALDVAGVPLLPRVLSRAIRHAYGAEIHWQASLAPGISIVHGNGVVISKKARVSTGCILFQNVTLGEGIDPETRVIGAPELGRDVHVGPGATLLGPISVGDGSKIMAGAVLTRSVPAGSLVKPAEPVVVPRRARDVEHAASSNGSSEDGDPGRD